ncbi:MAG TPA: SRPBCC family protein [Bryobacteraceae bacterium]|jgi:uncharacterized protein YndB with AHSA1/START domain|nr:SRPBCC family protein [Bryobacteraceae bacterium]
MGSDRIERKILLRASRQRVWRALSDSAEFGSWFGVKFEGPFLADTRVCGVSAPTKTDAAVATAQKKYEGTPFTITIEQMQPERLFSFRWHPYAVEAGRDYSNEPTTLVVFTLEEVAEGVMLTVTESGFDQVPLDRRAKAFTANEEGWSIVINLLEKHLLHAP